MIMWMLFSITIVAVMAYSLMILIFSVAWEQYPSLSTGDYYKSEWRTVSIVIAVRNESKNLADLISCLSKIQYPDELLEVVFSNDYSEDNSRELFFSLKSGLPFTAHWLEPASGQQQGKKAALENAITHATGDVIITTDADCSVNPFWVKSMVTAIMASGASFVAGPVTLFDARSILGLFQALDVITLMGSGAAGIMTGIPFMCNGANISFLRAKFTEVGAYGYGSGSPSGDDVFLMLRIAASENGKVVFNKSPDALVKTHPQPSLGELLNQRIRWASKVGMYDEKYVSIIGLIVVLTNLLLLLAAGLWVFGVYPGTALIALVIIKAVPEFVFLTFLTRFTRQMYLLFLFVPMFLVYPFYILVILVALLSGKRYEWKSRKYKY